MAAEKKIPFAVLEMLVYMVDHPDHYIEHFSGYGSDGGHNTWRPDQRDDVDFGTKPRVSNTTLRRAEKEVWIKEQRVPGEERAWKRSFKYSITDVGKVVAEANRDVVHPPVEAKRYLITKVSDQYGQDLVCGTLGALCEIVKSSEKRYYVRMIDTPTGAALRLGLFTSTWKDGDSVYQMCVQGNGSTKYIDAGNVGLLDVTVSAYEGMVRAYFDHTASSKRMNQQEQAEIADLIKPIKDRYEQRRAQRDAQLQIELNEIIGKKM